MASKKQGPQDVNEIAFRVIQEALGEAPKTMPHTKDAAAVERGKARSEKLSAEKRSEIARIAAQKRWAN